MSVENFQDSFMNGNIFVSVWLPEITILKTIKFAKIFIQSYYLIDDLTFTDKQMKIK